MSAFSSSAFSTSSFSTSAFDFGTTPVVVEENTAGFPVYGYGISSIDHAQAEYDAKIRKKQEQLLGKQLEAQELRLKQIELKDAETKQNKRQLAALDKEYSQLMSSISRENIVLKQLQDEYYLKFRNQQALLVLSMALPFFNVEGVAMN